VFPAATVLQPGAYALVVGFDPAANLAALTAFRAKYNLATTVPLFGPFQGRLNNAGESLELYQPDTPQAAPHPDAGYVPYVLVERVNYGPVSPWPVGADGTGASLQRVSANAYGNEPLNWTACVPSPGSGICSLDSDGDGLPDDWETAHGLDPHSALGNNGASGDPDGDGFTNWQEYLAGTDPQDRLSCLKIRFSGLVSGGIELRFDGVQGRSYTVQYSDALNTAAWQTLTHVSTMTSSTPVVVQDPSGASRTRFYRVVTPRLP
jgi:hypothetical protein